MKHTTCMMCTMYMYICLNIHSCSVFGIIHRDCFLRKVQKIYTLI